MTTMELNAMRCELAREILNVDSSEMLQKLQRYFKRLKKEQPTKTYAIQEDSSMVVAEDEVPYRTKAEILAGVEEAFECAKLAREGKIKGRPIEELLDEL